MNRKSLFLWTAVLGFAAAGARAQLPDLQVSGLAVTAPPTLTCGSQTVTFTITETNASVDTERHLPSRPAQIDRRRLHAGLPCGAARAPVEHDADLSNYLHLLQRAL